MDVFTQAQTTPTRCSYLLTATASPLLNTLLAASYLVTKAIRLREVRSAGFF